MKPLADRFSVSRQRLAYMLNNSASPVIVFTPVATTYIGYIIGVIRIGMGAAGIEGSAMQLFLSSLPFQFFSFTSVTIALLSVIIGWNFGSMQELIQSTQGSKKGTTFKQPAHAMEMSEELGNTDKAGTAKDQMGVTTKGKMEEMDMDMGLGKPALKPRLFNLLVPILMLIPLSFFLMWWKDLGLTDLIRTTLGGTLTPVWVPVLIFIVSGAVTYFIGSSWGARALMLPQLQSL